MQAVELKGKLILRILRSKCQNPMATFGRLATSNLDTRLSSSVDGDDTPAFWKCGTAPKSTASIGALLGNSLHHGPTTPWTRRFLARDIGCNHCRGIRLSVLLCRPCGTRTINHFRQRLTVNQVDVASFGECPCIGRENARRDHEATPTAAMGHPLTSLTSFQQLCFCQPAADKPR